MVWRRALLLCSMLVAADLLPAARPAAAQRLLTGALGGAAGLAAGGYVAIGIVTLQARRGHYLYSSEDALGWHAAPILVGPTTGFLIGFFDEERLRRTVLGGAIGGVAGTGAGWLAGLHFWRPPEGKWAGAVIGGAAGLLAGSLVGALWPASAEESVEPGARSAALPLRVVIPF